MALFIVVLANDLEEVLLASILPSILARLLLSTSDGIGPYSLGIVFCIGLFSFLLFL